MHNDYALIKLSEAEFLYCDDLDCHFLVATTHIRDSESSTFVSFPFYVHLLSLFNMISTFG